MGTLRRLHPNPMFKKHILFLAIEHYSLNKDQK